MQDRIRQIDETPCIARPDHTWGHQRPRRPNRVACPCPLRSETDHELEPRRSAASRHFLPSDPLSLRCDTPLTRAGYSVNLDGRMELDMVETNYQQLSNKLEQQPYNNSTDLSVGSILRLWDQPC